MNTIYDEAMELLSGGYTPEQLINFQVSEGAARQFEELIAREKNEGLLPEETAELDRLMELNRILSTAKARAMLKLSQSSQKAA